jgi:WD40 repeat protein
MPYCSHCGAAVEEREPFCSSCGQPLDLPTFPQNRSLRKRSPKAAVILIVLILVGGSIFLALYISGLSGTPGAVPVQNKIALPQESIGPENIDEVTQLDRLGKGWLTEAVFSPDGKLLAVASSIGIYLHDSKSLEEVMFIDTKRWVSSVSFSPDGTYLASCSYCDVNIWRVADGTLTRTI